MVACIFHSPLHHQKPDFEGLSVIKASSYLLPFVLGAHRESLPRSCETSARRLSAESAEVYSTADLPASAAHIPFSYTTTPPTIYGYAMHGPTQTSTPLLTTVYNIISKIKNVRSINCYPQGLQLIPDNTTDVPHTARTKRVHPFYTIHRCAPYNACSPIMTPDACVREEQVTPPGPHRPSSAHAKIHMRTYNRYT